jgi:hypothetical protein
MQSQRYRLLQLLAAQSRHGTVGYRVELGRYVSTLGGGERGGNRSEAYGSPIRTLFRTSTKPCCMDTKVAQAKVPILLSWMVLRALYLLLRP